MPRGSVTPRALNERPTRRALRRRFLLGTALAAVGVVLVPGFIALVSHYDDASQRLRKQGRSTTGTIVDVVPDAVRQEGNAEVSYSVGGRAITGTQDLGADADGYAIGQQVTVYYDPAQPDSFTIDGETNQPGWSVWLMIALLVAGGGVLGCGVVGLTRCGRLCWVLGRRGWQDARLEAEPARRRSRFIVRVWPVDRPADATSYVCRRSAIDGGVAGAHSVRLAGPVGRRAAITIPPRAGDPDPSPELIELRRPWLPPRPAAR